MDDSRLTTLLQLKRLMLLQSLGYRYHPVVKPPNSDTIANISTMQELGATIKGCQLCARCKSATAPLFDTHKQQRVSLLFVAFAPSKEEDLSQTLLGKHESAMIEAMAREVLKINKDDYRIGYALRCYAPTQSITEVRMCYPYLLKEIELLKPKVVVALDAKTLQLLCNDESIDFDAHIGSVIKGQALTVGALYHPSYLIRNPSAKKRAYQALLAIKNYL